jgi:hypothetical protein
LDLRAPIGIRFLAPFALVLFSTSAAHAQRVPEEFLWFAGASLFAPFVAIPVKLGILRLLKLEVGHSRLWSISAIEWILWFPLAFIVLRSGRPSSAPLIVLALFASVAWVHRVRLANASLRSAIFLSLPTPILAVSLPFLAFSLTVFLDSLFA